jgi:hypothetical protein
MRSSTIGSIREMISSMSSISARELEKVMGDVDVTVETAGRRVVVDNEVRVELVLHNRLNVGECVERNVGSALVGHLRDGAGAGDRHAGGMKK